MLARGPLLLAMLFVVARPAVMIAQEGGGKAAPKSHMVRDTDWYPTAGREAEVVEDDVPATEDLGSFIMFMESESKGVPLDPRWAGRVFIVRLARGTPVLVTNAPAIIPHRSSNRSMIQAALDGGPRRWDNPLTVRVLDGPSRDKVLFVPRDSVGVMKSVPLPVPPKPKARPRPVDPATRAETMLRSARNLEKAGKGTGAVRLYRDVARSFPGTMQASEAESRIGALGGR